LVFERVSRVKVILYFCDFARNLVYNLTLVGPMLFDGFSIKYHVFIKAMVGVIELIDIIEARLCISSTTSRTTGTDFGTHIDDLMKLCFDLFQFIYIAFNKHQSICF
jgi:hypothetical protein